MYQLFDTFNRTEISRHRTLAAAVRADAAFARAVKRANGATSYIPTAILLDGERVHDNAVMDEQESQFYGRF